ncbi:hypothetical protein QWA68_015589 [Fusarium oxysporum]|nr:hypothetical protein QWA68_015589 [Fusarium oxysporum]
MHQDPSEDNGRDSGKTPGDTPNGGVGAWLQVVGAFYSFPTLATGPIYDAGYFRQRLIIGLFLVSFGHMMLSLCRTYWQVLLAQACGIGLGAGVPSVAILSTYFTTHISFAVEIAALGASICGVVYPIVFRELQKQIGFAWSTRIIGFIALAGLTLSNMVMKLFAAKRGLTNSNLSFYLVSIMNSISTIGQILSNSIADIVGVFNMRVPCAVTCGV